MSAEANCWPRPSRACDSGAAWYTQHRPSNSTYRYLNSGGMIGPADLIVQLIDSVVNWASPTRYERDQRIWQVRLGCMAGHLVACTLCKMRRPAATFAAVQIAAKSLQSWSQWR